MSYETYTQQVNYRLAQVRYLLSIYNNMDKHGSPIEQAAIIDSALLQFHFAFVGYLNELLNYYRRPPLNYSDLITECFNSTGDLKKLTALNNIHEFKAILDLDKKNSFFLSKLVCFPDVLTRLERKVNREKESEKREAKKHSVQQAITLVEVASDDKSSVLNDIASIKDLVNVFQRLVLLQRENQAEY